MARFKILSIDGGGIRGIIPAVVLAEIERRSGRRIAESFDLIAGTSTGGILALGLTRPGEAQAPLYSASDLLKLYDEEGPSIFSRSLWHKLRAIGNALEERYPAAPLEKILERYFGEARLSEAVTNVMVTAYEIEQRRPFFFKSHNAKNRPEDDFFMRDAARATSAAPTYFEPVKLDVNDPLGRVVLVDGGVYANNPAACALVEAFCKFGAAPEDVVLVSLGTGELTRPIPYEEAKDWGLIGWAQPLLNVVFDGVSDSVNYQLKNLLNRDGRRNYYRLQLKLDKGSDDMDDASRTNLWALKLLATELVQLNDDLIDAICGVLTE